jgi:hypothetical protein
LLNLTDASLVLPAVYKTPSDLKAKKKGRRLSLGAKCDNGVVGKRPHTAELTEYEARCLYGNPMFLAAQSKGLVAIRGAHFDIASLAPAE